MATTGPTPTPTTGRGKKWWMIHTAAGIVTVALITIGITQCSGKLSERKEKEKYKSELATANSEKASLSEKVVELNSSVNAYNSAVNEYQAEVGALNDSIEVLNDSLAVVSQNLEDCRNSKRKVVKSAAKSKPRVVKPDTVIIARSDTARCAATNVSLNNSQNNGTIAVAGTGCGTGIKLDNGSVNNGAIVVGNGNNVYVNTGAGADTTITIAVKRKIVVRYQRNR